MPGQTEGLRYNIGKRKWSLLSWPAISQVVEVLEFGAKKYAAWNWTKGLSWSDTFDSMQRHLTAWYLGEDKDPETGLSHMAHVLCNAMFLMHFILFKTGRDDRPVELRGDKPKDAKAIPAGRRTGYVDVTIQRDNGTQLTLFGVGDALVERRVPDVQENVRPETQSRGC